MKFVRMLLNIAIYLATFYAAGMLHERVYLKIDAYRSLWEKNGTLWLITVLTTSYILLLGVFLIKRKFFKSEGLFRMCRFTALSWPTIGWLTLIGVACTTFFVSLIKISLLADAYPALNEYVELFMGDSFAITLIGVAVVGTIYEETLFRGLILNEFQRAGIPFVLAMLMHALFYAYFQPSLPISFIAFFLAVMYALLYNKIRSLWASIYVAAVINAFIFITRQIGLHETVSGWNDAILITVSTVSIALIVLILIILYRPYKQTGGFYEKIRNYAR